MNGTKKILIGNDSAMEHSAISAAMQIIGRNKKICLRAV